MRADRPSPYRNGASPHRPCSSPPPQPRTLTSRSTASLVAGALVAVLVLAAPASALEQTVDPDTVLDGKVLLSPSAERITTVAPKEGSEPIGPGSTATRNVIVQNRTTRDITFDIAISQVVGSTAEDVVEVRHGVRQGAAAWASIGRDRVTVRSGGTARMPVTIRIPKGVTPGSKSFAVTMTQQPSSTDVQGAGVTPVFRQVAIFVVDLPGDAPLSGKLDSVVLRSGNEEQPRLLMSSDDLELAFTYRNDGERILTPQGTLEVHDVLGRTVRTYPIERFTVYPEGENAATLALDDLPRAGAFTARVSLTSDAGEDAHTLHRVWVLPPWLLAPIALVLAAALVLSARWAIARRAADAYDDEDYDGWDDESGDEPDDDDPFAMSAAADDDGAAWDDDGVPDVPLR